VAGCRISLDWAFKGMRTLILENEYLRIVSLLDKGSDIMEFRYKPLDLDLMWHSPMGYRNPSMFVESSTFTLSPFLDFYGGGWQDILPIAGAGAKHKGAEWGLHGETALIPWNCAIVKQTPEEVIVHLSVECYRYPFRLDKEFTLREGETLLTIREKLTNTSNQDLEFCWLQHPAFGEPFLAPGTVIDIPAKEVIIEEYPWSRLSPGRWRWPKVLGRNKEEVDLSRIPSKDVCAEETVFITSLEEGWYVITNPDLKLGFGLTWDKAVYPAVWFWQNYNRPDYPWFGRCWNIALEPCTSHPGTFEKQLKAGTIPKIKGNSSIETEVKALVYTGLTKVKRITREGKVEEA